MIRLRFHREAAADLADALAYYDREAPDLGAELDAAVRAACARIRAHPGIGPSISGPYRRLLVPRFPYAIIYRFEPDGVFVVAVANLYRQPGYWRSRS